MGLVVGFTRLLLGPTQHEKVGLLENFISCLAEEKLVGTDVEGGLHLRFVAAQVLYGTRAAGESLLAVKTVLHGGRAVVITRVGI